MASFEDLSESTRVLPAAGKLLSGAARLSVSPLLQFLLPLLGNTAPGAAGFTRRHHAPAMIQATVKKKKKKRPETAAPKSPFNVGYPEDFGIKPHL